MSPPWSNHSWLALRKLPTLGQLQQLAQACGVLKSGTKRDLAGRLVAALASHRPLLAGDRILSIDMGLRNFAFCHFTLSHGIAGASFPAPAKPRGKSPRAGATKRTSDVDDGGGDVHAESPTSNPRPALTLQSWSVLDLTAAGDCGSKEDMSALAVDLVRRHLLRPPPLLPTRVLIERQRYRSGGGASVQEWTLRVNALEAMLHAILATMRWQGLWAGAVEAVDPGRASTHFFDVATAASGTGRVPARMLKKMKIDLLGSWIDGSGDAVDGARIKFGDPQAERTGAFFLSKWKPDSNKTRKDNSAASNKKIKAAKAEFQIKKLDDLTDCVIQGAAWASWQDMRTRLIGEGAEKSLRELL